MVEQKKRGRPKKSEQKTEKVEEEVKVQKIQALTRISHKDKTYEVDDIFEEEDEAMVEQIVSRGLGKKVG
jgi:hypothetical protein